MRLRKRVRLTPIILLLACVSIAFFWISSGLDRDISDADAQYQQAVADGNELENAQNNLKQTLSTVNSDAFIEKQARNLYDYMKQDELRIVITNPEALYGTDGH